VSKYFAVLDMIYEWHGPQGRVPKHETELWLLMLDELRSQFGSEKKPSEIIELWRKKRNLNEPKQNTVKASRQLTGRNVGRDAS
tara:strand:- start:1864 stop:2115 length:252 start_codon:yes stop_codon:yes gene_type:complete